MSSLEKELLRQADALNHYAVMAVITHPEVQPQYLKDAKNAAKEVLEVIAKITN